MTKPALLLSLLLLAACSSQKTAHDPERDLGILWVNHAAEYQAVSLQAYRIATADIAGFVADRKWSALPEQRDAEDLPPAIILDVDETVASNAAFQITFERPFENQKLDDWTRANPAAPVPGVSEFLREARSQGVELFFVTNRPCELREGIDDPCPQKQSTIDDIREVGIETDKEHVMLSEEQGWTREKSTRRAHVANTHRVIMLLGDDLSDFIPCVRSSPKSPCENVATRESRMNATYQHAEYWGHGWYILPNPMHGSWTSAR